MTTPREEFEKNRQVWDDLRGALARAREKHPCFAEGAAHGLGKIGEEYGELCQAINHNQGEDRIRAEALDLLVVSWRFYRGDYK